MPAYQGSGHVPFVCRTWRWARRSYRPRRLRASVARPRLEEGSAGEETTGQICLFLPILLNGICDEKPRRLPALQKSGRITSLMPRALIAEEKMTKLRRIAAAAIMFSFLGGAIHAQGRAVGRPPASRPTTSPYLFLLNRDNAGVGFNYYRNVRPEMEWRRENAAQFQSLNQMQNELNTQRDLLQSPTSQLSPTGHRTSFMNYGGYFSMPGSAGSAATPFAGFQARRPANQVPGR